MFRHAIAGFCVVAVLLSVSSVWTQDDEGPGKTEAKKQGNFGYKFEEGQKLTWTTKNTMTVEITEMPEERFEQMLAYANKARNRVDELRTDRPEIWFNSYSGKYAWILMHDLP